MTTKSNGRKITTIDIEQYTNNPRLVGNGPELPNIMKITAPKGCWMEVDAAANRTDPYTGRGGMVVKTLDDLGLISERFIGSYLGYTTYWTAPGEEVEGAEAMAA